MKTNSKARIRSVSSLLKVSLKDLYCPVGVRCPYIHETNMAPPMQSEPFYPMNVCYSFIYIETNSLARYAASAVLSRSDES